jgi:hypothetical protein
MSFTRFHDDECRIAKKNLETSSINDYIFNVPGNMNSHSVFFSDPHIRMQRSGGHIYRNMIGVENELKGMNISINNKDCENYKSHSQSYYMKTGVSNQEHDISEETRETHPIFHYREMSTYFPEYPLLDPQEHVEEMFESNLDTNLLEKDYYNLKTYKKI